MSQAPAIVPVLRNNIAEKLSSPLIRSYSRYNSSRNSLSIADFWLEK